MEMTSRAMASGLLLSLLLMNIGLVARPVLGSNDNCWVDGRVPYVVCTRAARCRSSCLEHGYVDGRCQWGFPNLVPICECLLPKCAPGATGATD
ncbi:hypothetical protein U9M48_044277 [Paspalum notatum var. saurae]|uniref:Knottin scorpion toxin-like domain-containing protein n=1 Tax=Paspalum notatum var. saurae TaxID=547442 RepID=A0AAQ3XJF4_PASNO